MAQDTSNNFKEYVLSINEFVQPKVLKGDEAAYTDIIRLFLLDPGTNQTHPEMGIGIRTRYRFSEADDISTLQREAKEQIKTYLPNLLIMDVQIKAYGTTIAIFITSQNNSIYGIGYDTNNGKIGKFTLNDMK